ncbi:MAG: Crp/Fnr family transcriptional regulator [Acaryochloridaceae cyanobacterium RU_4_10]|nr:Crp/Fnr family transcriptional regulator [Acaryochloridaceae cyanobacterium RU_4_10]
MSPNTLTLLESTAVKVFSRADQIPAQADVLWEIQRGIVRTQTWTEAGKVISLGYWGAGDVVGIPLAAIQPYEMFCMTPVMVRGLDPHQESVLPFLYQQVKTLQKLAWIMRQASVAEKLWSLLLWLFEKFGYTIQEGCLIDIRITHQDLAELADTSRVTVTRLLKQFEAQRLLCRRNKHYVLLTLEPDLLKLQSLALGKENTVQKILGCDRKS